MLSHEEHDFVRSQPLERMRQFAELLNWKGLQLQWVRIPPGDPARTHVPLGVVVFYMTTDEKFNLQINTYPHGQHRMHRATVKAERYGIINVGWQDFVLFEDDAGLKLESQRLLPYLDRGQFKDRHWRREFLRQHPQLATRFVRNARR